MQHILTDAGYLVKTIDLRTEEIPAECSLLITYSPETDLLTSADVSDVSETDKIEAFLGRGGNYMVFLGTSSKVLPNLESLLDDWGIRGDTFTVTATDRVEGDLPLHGEKRVRLHHGGRVHHFGCASIHGGGRPHFQDARWRAGFFRKRDLLLSGGRLGTDGERLCMDERFPHGDGAVCVVLRVRGICRGAACGERGGISRLRFTPVTPPRAAA